MNNHEVLNENQNENENENEIYDYSQEFQIKNINYLNTYFYYLNQENRLEKVLQQKIKLKNNENIVEKNQLLDLIKNNKFKNTHNLVSIMVYNIYVQPNQLYDYIVNDKEYVSLYHLKRIEQFQFKKTMKFLNSLNGIYLFFKENKNIHISENNKKNENSNTKKVILHSKQIKHKKTQKFTINGFL